MIFTERLREGVRRGDITCSVRIWTRPHVKAGNRYRMDEGEIAVDSVLEVALADVTPELARESGFKGVVDLLKIAKHGRGENVYLVRFHYLPPGRKAAPARRERGRMGKKKEDEQSPAEAEAQLESFVAKFEPAHQALIRGVRKSMRKRFPTAYELVYDNYNFLAMGYSPTERTSDAVVSIASGSNGVGVCFIYGAALPDPKKVLLGSGNQTRFIRIPSLDVLERPEVRALLAAAAARARAPFRATGRPTLVIRSVSAKQRPRRKSRD